MYQKWDEVLEDLHCQDIVQWTLGGPTSRNKISFFQFSINNPREFLFQCLIVWVFGLSTRLSVSSPRICSRAIQPFSSWRFNHDAIISRLTFHIHKICCHHWNVRSKVTNYRNRKNKINQWTNFTMNEPESWIPTSNEKLMKAFIPKKATREISSTWCCCKQFSLYNILSSVNAIHEICLCNLFNRISFQTKDFDFWNFSSHPPHTISKIKTFVWIQNYRSFGEKNHDWSPSLVGCFHIRFRPWKYPIPPNKLLSVCCAKRMWDLENPFVDNWNIELNFASNCFERSSCIWSKREPE